MELKPRKHKSGLTNLHSRGLNLPEVLFYHAGDFFSRDNIHPGMVTFHPGGFTHGPHPKALTRMLRQEKPATDEVAVMIDTRDPLEAGTAAASVEWTGYVDSWKGA